MAMRAEPWLLRLARVGFAANGLIFGLIGLFAFLAAVRFGGRATNQAGAVYFISRIPLGEPLLLAIGVSLLAYALWRLAEAVFNPEKLAWFNRLGSAISGLGYGGFGLLVLVTFATSRRVHTSPKEGASLLLRLPNGPYLGMLVALIGLLVALAQFQIAAQAKFTETLKKEEMSKAQLTVAKLAGSYGLISRSVLFGLIAWSFHRAATDRNPREAGGVEWALRSLAAAPFGAILLGLTGLGLIAYAVYMGFEARYHRMTPITRTERFAPS